MPCHTSPGLIDSHTHTDDERLAADLPEVLKTARASNIVAQIVPSTRRELWPRVKGLCAQHADLFACYGLHPCFCNFHHSDDLEALANWLGTERPVALGECGLDYHVSGGDKGHQQKLFAAQLSLAREFNLPIVIHANKAVEDVIRMIRVSGHSQGMVHSFNGSLQQARRLIDLGYKIGFGGAVTYKRASRLRAMVSDLPLESILLETDAPDQPDSSHSGQRNEPAHLTDIWKSICTLREESSEDVARVTSENAIALFNLPLMVDTHSQLLV
ncbi:MAG: TatD family hydrolase [Granulosicoccus sp.]|nr:TatD family hydrolase [Granulosicoccus sp.]